MSDVANAPSSDAAALPWYRRPSTHVTAIVAAGTLALAWWLFHEPAEPPADPRAFTGAPSITLACEGGVLERCPRGAKLVFGARHLTEHGYLVAWADPALDGDPIWYFSAEGQSPELAPADESTAELRPTIGPDHHVGGYTLHVLLSRRPLTRAETKQPPADEVMAFREASLQIVP